MNVSCPQCSTIYRVDPAKVPLGGVRARCSACGGVIPVGIAERQESSPGPLAGAPVTTAGASTWPAPPVRQTQPTPPRAATLPPLRPTPRSPWPAVPAQPPAAAPAAAGQPPRPFVPSQTPVSVPAVTPPPPTPLGGQGASHSAPAASAAPTPGSAATQRSAATPSQPVPGERRPINPFLARDPSLRAKRMARALVSDMVAYYPAKHSEGLQRGTLKELFREEIRKSYDEYVAQVGSDFARSTTHFQEALNEVLGAGKRIF